MGRVTLERTVTVATYNIHSGVGTDGRLDLERLAGVLEETGAEVVALQEVDRCRREESGFADQPLWLADRLGMEVAFGANLDLGPAAPGGPPRQYGTALLSRHPITSHGNALLPRFPGGEQRGLLDAVVDVGGHATRFLVTHLQHDNPAERLAQVEAILQHADAGLPTVLLGDLNARPDSAEYARVTECFDDVWAVAGQGAGHTFDALDPHMRIDYILTRGGVRPLTARLVRTAASDHLPVVAALALSGP
jgi:endonuclease/exonuclease/phosphatase family metal-dependent hydrolase